MSAFLFLPSAHGAACARRVDFANIGTLFAEVEEPPSGKHGRELMRKLGAVLLVLLLTVGDMVLVARPDALAACLFKPQGWVSATI